MVSQVSTASRESSSITLAPALALVQMRLWGLPTIQVSPPLGLSTVTEQGGPVMEKLPLLVSVQVGSLRAVTRTRAWLVGVLGTTQGSVPALGVLSMMESQLRPPSVEYSSLTLPVRLMEVQVTFWVESAAKVSPPLGEVTVTKQPVLEPMLMPPTTVADWPSGLVSTTSRGPRLALAATSK